MSELTQYVEIVANIATILALIVVLIELRS